MARRPPPHTWSRGDSALPIFIGWIVIALIVAGAWWGWQSHKASSASRAMSSAPAASAFAPTVVTPSASAPEVIAEPSPPASGAAVTDDRLSDALAAVFGNQPLGAYLQLEDAAHRVAATVDNLARPQATSRLWPVPRTPQRLKVVTRGGRTFIAPENAERYAPFVKWIVAADTAQLIDVYVRWLPSLQRAYEDLGFPNRRFHGRLFQAIDDLLAAPAQPDELEVRLVEVKGLVPEQPWTRYEFADPELESATAGQKMMLRTGAENRRRLEAKLREIRAELLARSK